MSQITIPQFTVNPDQAVAVLNALGVKLDLPGIVNSAISSAISSAVSKSALNPTMKTITNVERPAPILRAGYATRPATMVDKPYSNCALAYLERQIREFGEESIDPNRIARYKKHHPERYANGGPDKRLSEAIKAGWAKKKARLTQASASARKAWETRRRNAARKTTKRNSLSAV